MIALHALAAFVAIGIAEFALWYGSIVIVRRPRLRPQVSHRQHHPAHQHRGAIVSIHQRRPGRGM